MNSISKVLPQFSSYKQSPRINHTHSCNYQNLPIRDQQIGRIFMFAPLNLHMRVFKVLLDKQQANKHEEFWKFLSALENSKA